MTNTKDWNEVQSWEQLAVIEKADGRKIRVAMPKSYDPSRVAPHDMEDDSSIRFLGYADDSDIGE